MKNIQRTETKQNTAPAFIYDVAFSARIFGRGLLMGLVAVTGKPMQIVVKLLLRNSSSEEMKRLFDY